MTRTGFDLRRLAAGALLAVCIAIPGRAVAAAPAEAPAEAGDLWEVTSQMSMEGMPMALPAQKLKVCSAKEWKEPPAPADERQKCQYSDFKVAGQKASWKVRCAGPPEMTGEGEVVRDGDSAWTGTIKFASAEANMTLKMDGKRIGACDPGRK